MQLNRATSFATVLAFIEAASPLRKTSKCSLCFQLEWQDRNPINEGKACVRWLGTLGQRGVCTCWQLLIDTAAILACVPLLLVPGYLATPVH